MRIASRIFLTLFLPLFLFTSSTFGRELPQAQPHQVGLSAERLEQLKQVIQSYVDQEKIAGAVSVVVRHGKVAHMEAYGKRDIKSGSPMKSDTIFRIASMSKPVTSIGAMILYE